MGNIKNNNDSVWDKLPYIQNIHIPFKPDLFSPYSIYFSLFGQGELSGEHIYRINEIVQQNRDKLTDLTFQGLILGKQVKITNSQIEEDHYNKKYPEPNFYLDFTNSNFSKTRINKSYFKKVILTDAEFNGSIMLNSSFESCDLHRSSFDKTSIINSTFLKTKLTGTDFSKSNFFYNNADKIKKSFFASLYNSKPIIASDVYNLTIKNASNYCTKHQGKYDLEVCIEAIMKISVSPEVTKFPNTFDVSKYNLIDASDFIKFLKE